MYGDAAAAGVQRATAAGSTTPALLTICSQADSRPVTFGETISVALLGVLASQYVPLEVRESRAAAPHCCAWFIAPRHSALPT